MLELEGGANVEAMKVIKIKDVIKGCHVGSLPRHIVKWSILNKFKDAFEKVILLYRFQ
jgi:hypothetical protein